MMAVTSAAIAAPRFPEALPDRVVAAWNSHDPTAFEALYTVDAVWVAVAAERNNGACGLRCRFCHDLKGGGLAANTVIARQDLPEVHVRSADVETIFFTWIF